MSISTKPWDQPVVSLISYHRFCKLPRAGVTRFCTDEAAGSLAGWCHGRHCCSCSRAPRRCRRRTSRRRASTCRRIRDSPARNSDTGASVANRGCGASAASRATGAATSARRDQRPRRRRAQRSVLLPVICGPRRRARTRSPRRRRPAAAARRRACSTLPREIGRRRLPAARPAERTASAGPEESRASASSVACRGARR